MVNSILERLMGVKSKLLLFAIPNNYYGLELNCFNIFQVHLIYVIEPVLNPHKVGYFNKIPIT